VILVIYTQIALVEHVLLVAHGLMLRLQTVLLIALVLDVLVLAFVARVLVLVVVSQDTQVMHVKGKTVKLVKEINALGMVCVELCIMWLKIMDHQLRQLVN
jgi:hypothetical protein